MKFTQAVIAAAALAELSMAYPSYMDISVEAASEEASRNIPRAAAVKPFLGVPEGAVRTACPGLNTMANHGYINNSGKNITAAAVIAGFGNAFNYGPGVATGGASTALSICSKLTNTTCKAFDLDMLNIPHVLEHDASLTRADYEMGYNKSSHNNFMFNQTIWNQSKAFFGNVTHITPALATTARLGRVAQAQKADYPGWFLLAASNSKSEHAFFLTAFNDPALGYNFTNPHARLDWVDFWVTNQQLPTALGWVRPTAIITQPQIASLAGILGTVKTVSSVSRRQVSYQDLNEKDRRQNPALPVPRSVSTRSEASRIAAAAAVASSLAPQAPEIPNGYMTGLSRKQLDVLEQKNEAYVSKVQALYEDALEKSD